MTGNHWVAVSLVAAVAWGVPTCYKAYLENQRAMKQIEAQQLADQNDLRKYEMLAEVASRVPEARIIQESAPDFYNTLTKSASTADSVQVGGKTINRDTAQQLVRPTRSRAAEIQLNGPCRILKVDSSRPEGFMVEVRIEDGRKFTARLEEAFIATRDENRRIIQEAEWEKRPIYMMINARELRGDITTATIVGVRELNDQELARLTPQQ